MQEHYIHEVAELMYCEKCGAVFIDGPDDRTEMAAASKKRACKFCGDTREPVVNHEDCFPAETPVVTRRGNVPICDITSNDYVLTRKG